MRRTAVLLLAVLLVAGCSSEDLGSPDMSGLDEIQESLDRMNEQVVLPDACGPVDDPEPGLLDGESLVVKDRTEKGECERIPDVQEIACLRSAKSGNRLSVGRGVYQAEVLFRFVGADAREIRSFAEKAAAQIALKLA